MGKRHGGHFPSLLGDEYIVYSGAMETLRQHAGARHQEGRCKTVCFELGFWPVGEPVLPVENKVAQLVRRVEPSTLARFSGVQKNERLTVPVQGVGVKLSVI